MPDIAPIHPIVAEYDGRMRLLEDVERHSTTFNYTWERPEQGEDIQYTIHWRPFDSVVEIVYVEPIARTCHEVDRTETPGRSEFVDWQDLLLLEMDDADSAVAESIRSQAYCEFFHHKHVE